ncbi:MAG: SusD/RagB family nutrient-binding outer membrane lipoprotein [Saprospiraceae bacterium]|nr:SusD/RagB family nutrient-binding outer membrane lipoprotein [Saprospiraceae bacterium]
MMKKLIFIALLPILLLTSCVNSLDDYNVNSKAPSKVAPDPMFSYAQKVLADALNNVNVNTNVFRFYVQQITATTYLDEPRYDMTTRTIPQALWNTIYASVLVDLKEAKRLVSEDKTLPDAVKNNKIAAISLWEVYSYGILVNTFGNIPYSQALDIDNPQPTYDDAKTVTLDLLSKLDAALASITPGEAGFGDADIVYGGDMSKWVKFGNSLKLKLAMVIADVDAGTAKTAVAAAASDLGNLITSNSDNALFQYLSSAPNNNPLSDDVPPRSARRDFVAANTLVDMMNTLNDPRRPAYFTSLPDGTFKGGKYGFSNVYAENSTFSAKVVATDFPGDFLDASEVNFLLAEAVERGFISGNAEEFYNAAVTASMEYWGVDGAADYLAQDGVSYATAGSTWQQKIGNQKWIAMYNRGFDAWTDWRRLDFPALVKPDAQGVPEIPKRLIYPIIENTLNAANTAAAGAAIGGDDAATKLFWDVN